MVRESQRVYPHGELAAHVLGDVNLDSEGLEGVELWANERLRGKVVPVAGIKDALGRPAFIDAVAAEHVKDGEAVGLTIDSSLQFSVEQELNNAVARTGSRAGTVIVMNAVTGEILSMANQPSYNPNDKNVSPARRRNRALTDGYEPGSTLKPVLLAGALSRGLKLTDQLWGERGSFTVQGKRIAEAEARDRFEWLSLKQVIQLSSNVGAAKLALKLGADHFIATLKAFGFGSRTETGFPGEIPGRVPPRKAWQPLTLANIGFGQGILVTPMQMLRAYAAFENGGWLVQPTLLKSDVSEPGQAPGQAKVPPRRILSAKVSESVVEALRSVTEDKGTGVKARLEGYQVAGKTGTAQKVDPATGKYSRSKYVASFIGFPVGIEPKLVIFVSLDEPARGSYYAADTAAPLFSAVLNATANRFSLPGTDGGKPRLMAATAAKRGATDRIHLPSAKAIPVPAIMAAPLSWQGTAADGGLVWKMPPLVGLTAREAIRALQGHRFQLEVHGAGLVRAQAPEEGKAIADGGVIRLNLAEP
jgi:cell division protein FtsI (penicillin-binding protein 3)